jgi:ribosome-associated protein
LNGASAAADKAAIRLVAHEGDAVEDAKSGALAGLNPEELSRALLDGKSDIADHMIVASGRSARHVGAMADKIVRRLKDAGFGRANVEGANTADWVLIDAGDVIVHLFRPEVRQFYNLERVWSEAAHAPVKADA